MPDRGIYYAGCIYSHIDPTVCPTRPGLRWYYGLCPGVIEGRMEGGRRGGGGYYPLTPGIIGCIGVGITITGWEYYG
jgi:hypothetical protein